MAIQVNVNHRYGGHGGHDTEWEFSTRANIGRVKKLEELDHPMLVNFSLLAHVGNGGVDSFDVLRAVPECVVVHPDKMIPLLFHYLTMWPDIEAEREVLEQIKKVGETRKEMVARRKKALADLAHYNETGEER
jgi:hypothetical protein